MLPRTQQTSHRHVSNVVIGKPTAFGIGDILRETLQSHRNKDFHFLNLSIYVETNSDIPNLRYTLI